MELGYLHHKFLGQPILGKGKFDANFERIDLDLYDETHAQGSRRSLL